MTDLMTNVAPEATETQRACDIIRKVRELFDNGANWVQNSWAKRVYPSPYDGSPYLSNYDQNGRTLSPTDPEASKFCLVGAVAHVTGQDYENYRYWTGPAGKALDFLVETGPYSHYDRGDIVSFNDNYNTTWDEIDTRLQDALEMCIQEATQ